MAKWLLIQVYPQGNDIDFTIFEAEEDEVVDIIEERYADNWAVESWVELTDEVKEKIKMLAEGLK